MSLWELSRFRLPLLGGGAWAGRGCGTVGDELMYHHIAILTVVTWGEWKLAKKPKINNIINLINIAQTYFI